MAGSVWTPEVQAVFDRAARPGTRRVRVGSRTVRIPTPFPSPPDWRDPARGLSWTLIGTRTAESGWLLQQGSAIGAALLEADSLSS